MGAELVRSEKGGAVTLLGEDMVDAMLDVAIFDNLQGAEDARQGLGDEPANMVSKALRSYMRTDSAIRCGIL